MTKELNVLVDVSGSMAEDCKNAVVNYLLNAISSKTDSIKINVYLLGNSLEKAEKVGGEKISYGGQMSVNVVNKAFHEMSEGTPVLVISDGCFDADTENALAKHKADIVCVAVGSDALLSNLQRCSKNKKIYQAEDIISAITAY